MHKISTIEILLQYSSNIFLQQTYEVWHLILMCRLKMAFLRQLTVPENWNFAAFLQKSRQSLADIVDECQFFYFFNIVFNLPRRFSHSELRKGLFCSLFPAFLRTCLEESLVSSLSMASGKLLKCFAVRAVFYSVKRYRYVSWLGLIAMAFEPNAHQNKRHQWKSTKIHHNNVKTVLYALAYANMQMHIIRCLVIIIT